MLNNYKFPLKKIISYMEHHKLFPKSSNIVFGLSGGVDSVFLLYMLKSLQELSKIKNIKAIHINHGTRPKENCEEENFVKNLCKKLDISLKIHQLDLDSNQSSFENVARIKRYEIFDTYIEQGDKFATAHHLNDSFEWSLMNLFKTSSLNSLKGMPVKRGEYIKPLLCLTKDDILNYCKLNEIFYKEDTSNQITKYERNYVRNKLIPLISDRFPGYLNHFEQRLSSLNLKADEIDEKNNVIKIVKDPIGGTYITFKKYTFSVEQNVISSFFELSEISRSSCKEQISKIKTALKNGKEGPLTLPSNVHVFMAKNSLYLIKNADLWKYEELDKSLLQYIKKYLKNDDLLKNQETIETFKFIDSNFFFPRICLSDNKENCVKKENKLLPLSTNYLLSNNITFNYFSRLKDSDKIIPITLWTMLAKS